MKEQLFLQELVLVLIWEEMGVLQQVWQRVMLRVGDDDCFGGDDGESDGEIFLH